MADLRIEDRSGFGLVSIMARKRVDAEQIGSALGIETCDQPSFRSGAEDVSLIGTGAGTWLAFKDNAPADWGDILRDRMAGLASVSDQSGGYAILRLSGEDARIVLQRGMPIDLHPDVFGPGSAATTVISHIGAIVWQLDASPTYEVATFRSFSGSFRHWLDQAAAALKYTRL